jgi:glycosyltransferase involved in cell wall biosynthesis
VIASRIGALAEIVEDGRTGWHVEPGNAAALAAAIHVATATPAEAARRGAAARRAYLTRYTPLASLRALESIYADALAERHGTPRRTVAADPADVLHVA